MGLIDRFIGSGNRERRIPTHGISALVGCLVRGFTSFDEVTARFNMDAEDIADLDAMRNHYLALSDADKERYRQDVWDVLIGYEAGVVPGATVKSVLGIP